MKTTVFTRYRVDGIGHLIERTTTVVSSSPAGSGLQDTPAATAPETLPAGDVSSGPPVLDAAQQPEQASVDTPPAEMSMEAAAPTSSGRLAPALVRGAKTWIVAFAGMFATFLGYVQERITSLDTMDWAILGFILISATIAAALYALDKFLRPHAKF